MERYFQAIGAVLLAAVLTLSLRGQGKEIGQLLSLLVCAMVVLSAGRFLQPVMDFMESIRQFGSLNQPQVKILLKIVGISVTAEIATLICNDSGNSAMGKSLQFLTTAMILYLSLPLISHFLDLLKDILGKL